MAIRISGQPKTCRVYVALSPTEYNYLTTLSQTNKAFGHVLSKGDICRILLDNHRLRYGVKPIKFIGKIPSMEVNLPRWMLYRTRYSLAICLTQTEYDLVHEYAKIMKTSPSTVFRLLLWNKHVVKSRHVVRPYLVQRRVMMRKDMIRKRRERKRAKALYSHTSI